MFLQCSELKMPTIEAIIAMMDTNIATYIDPQEPRWQAEYARCKAIFNGHSASRKARYQRAAQNIQKRIDDLQERISLLKDGMITYNKVSQGCPRTELSKACKHVIEYSGEQLSRDSIISGICSRHRGDNETIEELTQCLDNRFSECIKVLERKLNLQQKILKNYMPK